MEIKNKVQVLLQRTTLKRLAVITCNICTCIFINIEMLWFMKRKFINSDDQQFHQYQQTKQSHLTWYHNFEDKKAFLIKHRCRIGKILSILRIFYIKKNVLAVLELNDKYFQSFDIIILKYTTYVSCLKVKVRPIIVMIIW
jgi:hypothetical protein